MTAATPTVTTSMSVASEAASGNASKLEMPTMTAGSRTTKANNKSLRIGCPTLLRQAQRAGLARLSVWLKKRLPAAYLLVSGLSSEEVTASTEQRRANYKTVLSMK